METDDADAAPSPTPAHEAGRGSVESEARMPPTKPTEVSVFSPPNLLTKLRRCSAPSKLTALAISAPQTQTLAAAMAFLAPAAAAALRAPVYLASSSRRRSVLPTTVRAAAGSSDSNATSAHPILSSLRLAASAAVLIAATSPAIACTPSPIPPLPAALTATVSPEDPIPEDSHPFEKLVIETAALVRFGDAEAARARLSAAASGASERCASLLAAQALFVDGKVDEAIAAFEELAQEDPSDYRPLFCQGVLYFVLGRGAESDSMLERCRELTGDEFGPDLVTLVSPADATVVNAESEAEKADAEMVNV